MGNFGDRLVTLSAEEIGSYATAWEVSKPTHEAELSMIREGFGYENLCAIKREIVARERAKAIEAFETTAEIKAFMLSKVRERGSMKPEGIDYTPSLKAAAGERHNPFTHKKLPPYKPEKGASGIKLEPTKAVRYYYAQEAYSDDSAVAIPYKVTGKAKINREVFIRNVSELIRRNNSHNGWAGSGATYEAKLHEGFVTIHCRSSISD